MTKILDLMLAADQIHSQILEIVAPYAQARLNLNELGSSHHCVDKINYITEVSKELIIVSCDSTEQTYDGRGFIESEDYELRIFGDILRIEPHDLPPYVDRIKREKKIAKLEAEKLEIERKLSELM